jgi:hypothetical protein
MPMIRRGKLVIVVSAVLLVIVLLSVYFVQFIYPTLQHPQKGNGYPRGVTYGETQVQLVDSSLTKYVNLTTDIIQREEGWHPEVGREMGWRAGYANLRWTGSSDDSVKSIQNIHLAVYTRLDSNITFGKDIKFMTIGLHAVANRTEPIIPNDAIGFGRITVPILGIDNPTYSYFFNCSSYF